MNYHENVLRLIGHTPLVKLSRLTKGVKATVLAKMENLSLVEEEIFKFLRNAFHLSARKIKPEFEKLLHKIKQFEKSRFETRAFAYLDIISWVESKVYEKTMGEIIHEKYLQSQSRRKSLTENL